MYYREMMVKEIEEETFDLSLVNYLGSLRLFLFLFSFTTTKVPMHARTNLRYTNEQTCAVISKEKEGSRKFCF